MNRMIQASITALDRAPDRWVRGMVITTAAIVLLWAMVGIWHQTEYTIGNLNRTPPLEVVPMGDPPVARAGERVVLKVRYEYDKSRIDCAQMSRRIVVDSKLVAFFLTTDAISGEARKEMVEMGWFGTTQDLTFTVPVNAAPGPAWYEVRMQFVCNKHQMKRPIEYVWRAPFMIVR